MFGLFASKGPFTAKVSSGETVTVAAGDNLLKAALEAGLAWPHNCRVGSCGECRTHLLGGKIKELNDFSYVLSKEEMDAGMILACQTCLRSDIEVDVTLGTETVQPAKSVKGAIEAYAPLTHDIVEIGVRLDETIPAYLAGQYAELSVPGVINLPRSYSFASAPDGKETDRINFFVRQIPGGEMTSWLHESDRTGSQVEVTGPYGSFWLRESDAPVLCIAGGSGLAPIKALLEQLSTPGFTRRVVFLFGARTQKDLYCLEEMQSFVENSNSRFDFIPVLSEEPEESDWSGLRGMVTEFISDAVPSVAASHAYLCGPPGMIDAAIAVLQEQGIDKENIHYDKFLDASHMPSGRVVNG